MTSRQRDPSPDRDRDSPERPTWNEGQSSPRIGRTLFSDEAWRRVAGLLALSARESEILQAVFEDQKEYCIAVNLGISSHTVHTHLERIYRKLHVSSRVELVVRVFAAYLSHQAS